MAVAELKAAAGRCEEASTLSGEKYIPCNAPATVLVKHKGRTEGPYRMCPECASHNVHNRNAEIVRELTAEERVERVTGEEVATALGAERVPFVFPNVQVIEDVQSEVALVPRVNAETIARIDDAIEKLGVQARAFECAAPGDFAAGDTAVGQIRKLEALLKDVVFGPEKKFWGTKYDAVLAEEKKRLPLLEQIKKTIGAKMIAWNAAEQQRVREAQRVADAQAKKEAEDLRIAQALQISERAKQQATMQAGEEMEQAAEKILDEPLDIVPTKVLSAVPLGGATKIQQRDHVEVTNLGQALIAIGATLLSTDERCTDELRALLQPFVAKAAADITDSPKAQKNITVAIETWARDGYKLRGDKFKVEGIFAGKKDVLG